MAKLNWKRSGSNLLLAVLISLPMTACEFMDQLSGKKQTKSSAAPTTQCKVAKRSAVALPENRETSFGGMGSSLEEAIEVARKKCSAEPLNDCRDLTLKLAIHRIINKDVTHGEIEGVIESSIGPVSYKKLTDFEDDDADYWTVAFDLPQGNE